MGRVEGRVAIITGAAQGIGASYARVLAREGARVFVCPRCRSLYAGKRLGPDRKHIIGNGFQGHAGLAALRFLQGGNHCFYTLFGA